MRVLLVTVFCWTFFKARGQLPPNIVTQQQSQETCRALEAMIAGQSISLGTCFRNVQCTMVVCVSANSTLYGLTIFPCTRPVTVQAVSNFGTGMNLVLTEGETVPLSPSDRLQIFFAEIDGGIRLGLSQVTLSGLISQDLLPLTNIPLRCNLAIIETTSNNIDGRLIFTCTAIGVTGIQFHGWERAFGKNATGETTVTNDTSSTDTVISARLEIADTATCQQDGGYVCVFHNGNPNNTVRSSQMDCPKFVCEQGDIRLQGGVDGRSGRVEVCNNNMWGTVCNDLWETADAVVACRQLGFMETNSQPLFRDFVHGVFSQSIWLSAVECTGDEPSLFSCGHNAIGVHESCDHFQDAGVICSGVAAPASNLTIDQRPETASTQVASTTECEPTSDGLPETVVAVVMSFLAVILLMTAAMALTLFAIIHHYKKKLKMASVATRNATPVPYYDTVRDPGEPRPVLM